MVILFIGPSGSGKDTQANLLNQKFKFDIVSSGELIRDISTGDRKMQTLIRDHLNKGFSPNFLVYGLLEIYLKEVEMQNFILTGLVRRLEQIELLDTSLINYGDDLDKVFYFELSNEAAIERIKGRIEDPQTGEIYHTKFNPPPEDVVNRLVHRPDDLESTSYIKRLNDFYKENDAIAQKYEERGLLVRIDASKSIEEIHLEIVRSLDLDKSNAVGDIKDKDQNASSGKGELTSPLGEVC